MTINDYVMICEDYNITERSILNYINETEQLTKGDLSYQAYVTKCKNKGKIPMSKAAYLDRKNKLKKGLAIGAGLAAAGAAAGVGGHILGNSQKYQDYKIRQKKNRAQYKMRSKEIDQDLKNATDYRFLHGFKRNRAQRKINNY